MANFLEDKVEVRIPTYAYVDGHIEYFIQVYAGQYAWTASRRYRDFYNLHEMLKLSCGLPSNILPPKKLLNKNVEFLEERRKQLELYLNEIIHFLKQLFPIDLVKFLDLEDYDVGYILFKLSNNLNHPYSISQELTVLQVYSISQQIIRPCTNIELQKVDGFSRVLEACAEIRKLKIVGCYNYYKTSNICPNKLAFDLKAFKKLEYLFIENMPVDCISDASNLRQTLKTFRAPKSKIKSLGEILLCDNLHKFPSSFLEQTWKKLEVLDLTDNLIEEIDLSTQLIPNIVNLILRKNRITEINNNLVKCCFLRELNLSENNIETLLDLNQKLGNVKSLNFASNKLTSLKYFSSLYSIESLNMASNSIFDIDQVNHLSQLPCLNYLVLTGNKLSTDVDYRVKVLSIFGHRAPELVLDNEVSSQSELDRASILHALNNVFFK